MTNQQNHLLQCLHQQWGVHINAIYAIYRLMHIFHIKLHISAYFQCIFFAYLTITVFI